MILLINMECNDIRNKIIVFLLLKNVKILFFKNNLNHIKFKK